jgi:hypothetical protein
MDDRIAGRAGAEKAMKPAPVPLAALILFATAMTIAADPLRCDLTQYKASTGLTAMLAEDLLIATWRGEDSAGNGAFVQPVWLSSRQ